MKKVIKSLDGFIKPFEMENFEGYMYITLIQDNSPFRESVFFKENILSPEDENKLYTYIDDFFRIYVTNFEGNEREEVYKILARILPKKDYKVLGKKFFEKTCSLILDKNGELYDSVKLLSDIEGYRKKKDRAEVNVRAQNDQTIITLCLKQDGDEKVVVGGMILEYYSSREMLDPQANPSYCILTYLFFDEEYRNNGLGKYFIKEILPIITSKKIVISNNHKNHVVKPYYVFFEVDNPMYAPDSITEEKWKGKLSFFNKIGARWLDIAYVQPKLSNDQERVYNLLFMILPEVSSKLNNPFIIDKYAVLGFLIDFYNTLESLGVSIGDFDLNKLDSEGIISKDLDLARIWLAIEIADAIDDFENNLQYSIVVELKKCQKIIEDQLDFMADLIKNMESQAKDDFLQLLENKKNTMVEELLSIAKYIDSIKQYNQNDNNDFYLKEVPRFEYPKLQIDKTSIGFNIALAPYVDSKYFRLSKNKLCEFNFSRDFEKSSFHKVKLLQLYQEKTKAILKFDELNCPIFKSYENDLLAFNYYEEKSRTKNKFLTSFTVDITFPYKIEFLSEGRKESIFLDVNNDKFVQKVNDNEKKYYTYKKTLKGFLNIMYFKDDLPNDLVDQYVNINYKSSLSKKDIDILFDYEVAKAKSLIWNIVFTNERTDDYKKIALNEYEIIALSKLFSGKQERSYLDLKFDNIKPKDHTYEEILTDIFNIIKAKVARENNVIYDIHSGIIQLDTLNTKIFSTSMQKFTPIFKSSFNKKTLLSRKEKNKNLGIIKSNIFYLLEEYLKDNVDNIELLQDIYGEDVPEEEAQISNMEVYRNARNFHYNESFTGFEDRYNENKFLNYFFNALCGISLGIFDFHRMGYEEVTDTILPLSESATDNAMIIMKRTSLFSCCHDNSVYDSSIGTIGMSPYLIIPNSVLVYNRFQADFSKEFTENLLKLSKEDIRDREFIKIRREAHIDLNINNNDLYQILLKLRNKVESYFDNIYLPNIFNYSTEQEIYTIGMKDRGIDELYSQIKVLKDELDEKIIDLIEIRRTIFSLLITIFLGLISFGGFYDPITTHLDMDLGAFYIANGPMSGQYTFNIGAIFFHIALWIFIFYFGYRLNKILPKYITVDWKKYFNYSLFLSDTKLGLSSTNYVSSPFRLISNILIGVFIYSFLSLVSLFVVWLAVVFIRFLL